MRVDAERLLVPAELGEDESALLVEVHHRQLRQQLLRIVMPRSLKEVQQILPPRSQRPWLLPSPTTGPRKPLGCLPGGEGVLEPLHSIEVEERELVVVLRSLFSLCDDVLKEANAKLSSPSVASALVVHDLLIEHLEMRQHSVDRHLPPNLRLDEDFQPLLGVSSQNPPAELQQDRQLVFLQALQVLHGREDAVKRMLLLRPLAMLR
mmetsp:Transcript_15421/g.51759  ORF Transcript_15421/g.51759 Transcript_15421/m.51759 type:complete len:207 (+) Transcript_15421:3597-4217(+)